MTDSDQRTEEERLGEAIESERQIAEEAATLRGQAKKLTPDLFLKLYPLLCKPIPEGFIQHVGQVTGKPYESTGIRSVQVQIDRMNNVLTPLWWHDHASWDDEGKLCFVKVYVGSNEREEPPLAIRQAAGGVDRGSSRGNIYKGSYTNAAKLAFARLGPGHEIYIGAADFDPDVDVDAAAVAPEKEPEGELSRALAKQLVDRAWQLGLKDKFRLAASHAAGGDVGDCGSKAKAIAVLKGRPLKMGERLDAWLQRKADEQAAQS